MTNQNDNVSKLYHGLIKKGYTQDELGDESKFRQRMSNESNRRRFYDYVSGRGDFRLGDYDTYETRLISSYEPRTEQEPAQQELTTYQPTPEEVQQYTLQNKPDIFKPKTGSLVDRAAGIEAQEQPTFEVPNVLRGITTKETVEDLYNTVGNAYSTANQMGERMNARVDMLSKNLQDPEYLRSRNDVELRGLNSEIDDLLEKAGQEESISVGGSAFMPAGARGRAYVEANKGRVEDITNLSSAKRLLEQSKYIADAARRGDTGVLSDAWQGFKDSLEVEDFTFGLADAASSAAILDALKKVEKGETLTEAEDKLLRASAINMATQYYYANDLSRAYKAGQVSAESVPFMLEMAINPISSFGKASAKTLLNYGLKSFAKQVGKGLGKGIVSGTGMALTTGLGRVASGTTDRLSQGYNYGVDFDGNLYAEKKKNAMGVGEAFARSLASTAIENQSEMIFNAFKGVGGFMKGVQDVLPGGVNKFFDMLSHNKVADAYRWLKNSPVFRNYLVKDVRNATQIGGIFEEYAEEVYNNLANFAIGEMSWEDVVSLDKNIDTFLGLAPTQVMFGILGLGGAASMRYQTRKTLEDLQATMNEQQRKELEGLLDMGIDAKEVDVRGFIRGVMENQNYTIENKRDLIKAAYYVAQQRSIDELTKADVIDKVNAENQFIDSMTDPSTGNYAELSRTFFNPKTGESEQQKGYVVGWIGEGEKRQPIFVADGMENNYANRVVLKPTEWSMDSYREMPAEQVKAVNEEMNREEAAQQAEREAKYAPEVLNAQMPEGEFTMGGRLFVPSQVTSDGVVYDIFDLNEKGKPTTTIPVESRPVPIDEYRDMLQAQIDAQEAAAPVNVPSGESVGEEVNAEVNAPVNNENVQPVAEGVATEPQVAQPQAPIIPTKEDGSIDFVSYGKEGTFKTLGEKYGEKMPNKVAITAKALAEDVKKAQKKLNKAEEAYDNAPIGREQKAEEALDKAKAELEAIQREANFWAEMDAEIKEAQAVRESMLNPQAEVNTSSEPLTADEFVAQQLASGNIVLNKEDYKRETGYGDEEVKAMNGGSKNLLTGDGMTIQEAGERLMEMDRENGTNFFDQSDPNAGRDELLSVLGSVKTRKELNQYVASNRAEQAKRDSEGLYNELERQVMDAHYASLEDYVLQMEASEMENTFDGIDVATKDAIFAEAEEEYQQYLNSLENGQGTTSETVEGSDNVLSEEQSDNTGGIAERQEQGDGVGEGASEESERSYAATEELKQEEGETTLQFAERAAEENDRREPLRNRAREWAVKLGVTVNLIESVHDVYNIEALAAIQRGQRVTGWFEESTGEVCFYMPFLDSESEVDATFIHEVVAHKGLRGLLGEKFDAFCDEVWDVMSNADRVKFMAYPGVSHLEGKDKSRAAADEYIAHLAENVDVTESAWSKLTELIKRFLKAIGLEPKMTNADIVNTIKKSYQRLLEGDGGASVVGEGTRFSAKKKASKTVLPEDISSFKGSVVSDADRTKVLNNLDNLQKVYEEKSSKRQKTFISDLSKALHLRNNGNNSNYADYVTVNGEEVTIRVSDHNVSVKDMYDAGKSNGISIVIGRKPNEGIREFGEAHIVEYYYNNKKLENSESNPYSEIIQSFKQTVYSGEYKDTTGLAERQEVNESRFRVVFHGSGAEFDKFDHSFMGTGEGNQSFGWGTYVTDVKGIGENYGTIALRGKDMFEYIGDQSVNRWVLADAKQMMDRAGGYNEMIKLYGNTTLAPGTATEQAVNFLKSTKKEDWEGQRHLYEVEIPDDNGSNYIAWDKMLPQEQAERIKEAIRNSSFFKEYEKDFKQLAEERLDAWTKTNGGRVYKLLGNIVWNEKDLSQILSEAGFVGFKYPTNYMSGGNKEGTSNYVIFNEDDLKIVEHTRFRVAKDKNELVAVHNISEDNLRKVLNVGGLIMPSIAITKADMGHEGYGEISLLFEKETINPADRRNKVYGGDAWTPRFPSTTAKINDKVSSKVYKKIKELIDDRSLKDLYSLSAELHADNIERTISDRGVEGYYDKEWMKLAYLLDNGKKVKIPMKMKDYGFMSEKILEMVKEKGLKASDIQDGGYKFYQDNADIVEAVKRIEIENKLQSFPEEKRDALEKLLNEKDMTYSRFDSLISSAIRMEYDLENGGLKKIIDRAALRESIEKKVKTNNADYNKWVDNLFDGIVEKYGIRNNRDWYTPYGNLRPWEQLYDNATPANILKHMLAENEQGGSGGFFDSNIMGASAETYESIEQIREKGKKRLRKLEEGEYDEWSNSIAERMSEICNDFLSAKQRNEFGSAIDAKIDITNAVAKDKTASGIYKFMKRDYPGFTMEHAKKVEEIVKEIQDFAIGYFEAKPRRIVPLSEVRKAIVPKKTSEDILEGLRNNGIEVATYKSGDEAARARLIKKESNGIRFRFIGEKGARNLDKAEEATTRLDNLAIAREMESAEKDAKTIKMATGWERGADGLWRYEVDDNIDFELRRPKKVELKKAYDEANEKYYKLEMRVPVRTPKNATEEERQRIKDMRKELAKLRKAMNKAFDAYYDYSAESATLGEFLGKDNQLFKEYPELADYDVSFLRDSKKLAEGLKGSFTPEYKVIWVDDARPKGDIKSTLVHEIQHAIQGIEGFAQGGTPAAFASAKYQAEEWKVNFNKFINRYGFEDWSKNLPTEDWMKYGKEYKGQFGGLHRAFIDNAVEDEDVKKTLTKELNYVKAAYDKFYQIAGGMDPAYKFKDANEWYRSLSGEVESRNVQQRMGMTDEQRRNTLAESTEDVAREDQIFLRDGIESGETRLGFVREPAIDYVSQANDVVEVPREEVMYTMNNIANQLYKVSGRFMRELYKYGTIGRVLKVEYAEIDQIKAKREYNHAKPIFDEYLNELVWMKYQSTEAAQEVINDVISDVEYAMQYYKDLALGKDVWRTKDSPRFRISEKRRKDVRKAIADFTSSYNSKPVVVLESSMTDGEIEGLMEGYSAKEIRDRLDKKSKGGYSKLIDKIYIFAENNSLDEIEDTLFHENLHVMFGRSPLVGELYANVKAKNDKADEDLFEHYTEKDVAEELFVSLLAQAMVSGKVSNAAKYLSNESRDELLNTLKGFGYDNEIESRRRRRSLSSRGAGENQEQPEGTRTLPYSQNESGRGIKSESQSRERLGRLQQLFGRVADMGLDGVLGNKEYVNAMVDMYKVLPEAVQREVADEALSRYGGDVAPAVSDWLNHKADASVWDKVVAVIREALRKVGFDLDLNTNEAKYILWRSQKPLNRNNLLEVAEDIDMKYRLKVGEYSTNDDGTTPDGGGTKFRESKEKLEGPSRIYKDFNALHDKGARFRVSGKLNVRDEYEATIKKGGFQAREAVQDAMLSLRRFQELIEKVSGKKIRDFENAWMHENRLSSVVQAQIHEMERKFYKPMMDAVKKLMAVANLEQEQVADYLMLKHGIERNREMAVRKALTDSEGKIDRTRLEQWYQDKRNVRSRAATPHLDTWRKQQEELDNIALMYGADMSRDYSGLTSMFGTDDLADSTQQAYDEVEALETAHPAETEALGKAIKAMTQNTLDESFGSGLMDRKVYDELSKDMYDYYIPLRGFEETTSDEVYAYLDQDRGVFNAPLKRAKGRSSKSDNPIAYLKSIAESGIMQGERNKMKQSFLNLVINNPSDLVSVREGVWVIYNPASGEWEAAAPPAIPNNATPADVEAAMEAWEANMESLAASDPNVKKISEAQDIPYRVVGNRMNQHQVIVKRLGKSYTLTINGNPRLAMALNGLTNPNNKSNDGKVAAYVSSKIDSLNRTLSAWYTTRNPDFVASNFMRDTFYTNTIVRAKEGDAYANKFHKNYGKVLPQMLILFSKYERGTLNPANKTEAAFLDFMMNGGETGYSNLKDLEEIKKQIAKELKGNRFAKVEELAEKLDILNRAVENTARFAAFLTSREEGRSIAKSVFDAKEISVNFNKKGAGGTFFGMTGQTWFGNLAAMVGAGGRALYVFFNAAVQGTTNLMHVMKVNPKGTSAGLVAMFLMGAVVPFLFGGDDDDEKDYYDLPEHVRRNHLIIPGTGDAWISIPLPIEYRIMYGMGELLSSWRSGHERGSDIARKMLNLTGQALPLNFLEEGLDAFVPSAISPIWQVYNNRSWTGLPIYKDNEFNKDDPEYTKAFKNTDRGLVKFTKALYEWTFDEDNQEEGIDLNPAVIETLAKGYFGGLATQLSNIAKVGGMIAGEQEFDWRNIPIGNRILKTGDERTKEKRVTNEYFENMEKLDFLQSRERMLKKTEKGVAVPEADKFKAQKDLETMQGTEVYKKYQEFKKQKKVVDKIRKTIKEKGSTPELEKKLMDAQEAANKAVR